VARDASEPDLRIVVSGDSLEVVGDLDRRRAEMLAVELRAAARRRGLDVRSVRVLPDDEAGGSPQ
jgi:hypothetical protein